MPVQIFLAAKQSTQSPSMTGLEAEPVAKAGKPPVIKVFAEQNQNARHARCHNKDYHAYIL